MTIIDTDEFGRCLNKYSAVRFLESNGLHVTEPGNGALKFKYPGQEPRIILPLFIQSTSWIGWAWAEDELRRDYVKPAPEKVVYTIALPEHRYARPGKSVWRTLDDVKGCLDRMSSEDRQKWLIWTIAADWERDTVPSAEGDWHDLLIEAEAVEYA